MNVVFCPNCKKGGDYEIYKKHECPSCGCPFYVKHGQKTKRLDFLWGYAVLGYIFLILVLFVIFVTEFKLFNLAIDDWVQGSLIGLGMMLFVIEAIHTKKIRIKGPDVYLKKHPKSFLITLLVYLSIGSMFVFALCEKFFLK